MMYKVIRRIEEKSSAHIETARIAESGREKTYAYRKLGFMPQLF